MDLTTSWCEDRGRRCSIAKLLAAIVLLMLPLLANGQEANTCFAGEENSCTLTMTTIGQPYSFNFGSHILTITPHTIDSGGDIITVTGHDGDSASPYPFTGTPVVYSPPGTAIDYEVECLDTGTGTDCEHGVYDIQTLFFSGNLTNPGFFWYHRPGFYLPGPPPDGWTRNIITSFNNQSNPDCPNRTSCDPAVTGGGGDGYSGFEVFQNVHYGNADLALAVFAKGETETGKNLMYEIPVANLGPDTAYAVTVTDTVPAGTTFVGATYQNISCVVFPCSITPKIPCSFDSTSGTVACNVQPIPAIFFFHPSGAIVELVVKVTAGPGTTITDSANVSSALNNDPNTANNRATIRTRVPAAH